MTKLESKKLFCFKTVLFGHISKENQHIHFLMMHGHSSRSTFGLHLVNGPKAFWVNLNEDNMLVNLGWVDLNKDNYVSQFRLSRPKILRIIYVQHNTHANLGQVDLNYHPKWSILSSASLRNLLVLYKSNVVYFTCTLQPSSGFHFILGLIVCFMYSQFTRKLSI